MAVKFLDGNTRKTVQVATGVNVQTALEQAGLSLGPLDRTDPPTFSLITAPTEIKITRVAEEYEVEEKIIPFERQTVRNESLPEGEMLLIQPGENGVQQITYRRVLENGVQTGLSVFKVTTISEARPEIVMIGVQAPFQPVEIPGRLVYLTAGNAWMMENTTANRRPILASGDLDGRVFSLSPDGDWLLFTRNLQSGDDQINSLWVINLAYPDISPIPLGINNVIHYAGWDPDGGLAIYYSTVEPRSTAPGWQANNDLRWLSFTADGTHEREETILDTNTGGIYGWWGTEYVWSPDGSRLAYARPNSIGLVDFDNNNAQPLFELIPYQTGGDWSWVPGIAWSSDSQLLYAVTHAPMSGMSNDEASPVFNLSAYVLSSGSLMDLLPQVGMFAFPVASPSQSDRQASLALLQSVFPEQSQTSRYRMTLIDQDGSNARSIYPPEGSAGIDPQRVVWSPRRSTSGAFWIAYINQGNICLINPDNNEVQQITGDGLISRLDWK